MKEINVMFLNLIAMYKYCKMKRRHRRWKIRPINKDWSNNGYFQKHFLKIKNMDSEQLFLHTRITRPVYEILYKLVANSLRKFGQRIHPEERLSLTLLYLAHGVSIQSIAWSYKLGKTTVRNIILETCDVLWKLLSPVYVSEPTEAQYKDISKDFEMKWNVPNCVGAIDGKHIQIKCPSNSGSLYFNYKKFFSIVLMATCDAKYTFTSINIGSYGSQSDGGVFSSSRFGKSLLENTLPLPPDCPLSQNSEEPFPHFFVGDAAFPLKKNLMRPYPGSNLNRTRRIFNYRLSRARRVIENSFGILTARWRVLRNVIEFSPENCEKIVLACVALHNFIMLSDQQRWYCPESYVDWDGPNNVVNKGNWRQELHNLGGALTSISTTFSRRATISAFQLRDKLAEYFVNEGAIPFQNSIDLLTYGPYQTTNE